MRPPDASVRALTIMEDPGRGKPAALRWFVPVNTWWTMWACGAVAICLGAMARPHIAPWSFVGLVVAVAVVWHTFLVCRRTLWLPGIIASVAAVQWVLAPFFVYHDASGTFASNAMAVPEDVYFAYAVPSLLALIVGLFLPMRAEARVLQPRSRARFTMSATLRTTCEVMVWGGLALRLAGPLVPSSLRFAVLLLAQLSFVGAFAETLASTPRWWLRLGVVLLLEFAFCARDGTFLTVLQWGLCAGAILVYRYRPRPAVVIAATMAGLLLIGALNVFKHLYRNDIVGSDMTDAERAEATSEQLTGILADPITVISKQSIAVNMARLNQGQLTSWVLAWVPLGEPFAHGETISAGIRAALLPRVLDPNKYVAGGSEYFQRFTGKVLMNGTSMNLSIPGEMYANFGYGGGILAVLVYSLALGIVFRHFFRWARRSPLWWAWAPLVFLNALSAEDGFGEGINRLTKALLVVLVLAQLLPAWRELRPRRRARVADLGRAAWPPVPALVAQEALDAR